MSYEDQATLVKDYTFMNRVAACVCEQSLIFVNDARPEYVEPAQQVISNPASATEWTPLVVGSPGMTAESSDADILAAVQAVWPKYGAAIQEGTAP